MRKIALRNDGYYHVFSRGVDKRIIFVDDSDYLCFYQFMYLFNDANYRNPGNIPFYNESLLSGHERLLSFRSPLVSIMSYCLRPNHFHFFVRQVADRGIERFLHKIQAAYASYFNKRVGRQGKLFDSPFKAVGMEREGHFLHMPRYIHLNAIDEVHPEWRSGTIRDWAAALAELESYPWSSHSYFMGRNEYLPVLDRVGICEAVDLQSYPDFLKQWASMPLPRDFVAADAP